MIVIVVCNEKHEKVVTVDYPKVGSTRVDEILCGMGGSLVIRKTSGFPSLF